MKKKFYNPEMNTVDIYEEVWIVEKINIKDEKNLLVKNHYWRDKFGELWADFDNPMENVYRGFEAYRTRKGFLSPEQIKKIRNSVNMSVREFADALGISSSTLTKIENNHRIQTKYQDQLFKLVNLNKNKFLQEIEKIDEINKTLEEINTAIDEQKYIIENNYYSKFICDEDYKVKVDKSIGVVA